MRHWVFVSALLAPLLTTPAMAENVSPAPAATDPDQKIKCPRVEVTGSLLKKGKVCRTVAEWNVIMENGNRVARAIVQEGAKPTN